MLHNLQYSYNNKNDSDEVNKAWEKKEMPTTV
jgi:hypothetical protein